MSFDQVVHVPLVDVNQDDLDREVIIKGLESCDEAIVLSQLEQLTSWTSNDGLCSRLSSFRLSPHLLKLLEHTNERVVDAAASTMSYLSGRSAAGPYRRPWTFKCTSSSSTPSEQIHTLTVCEPSYSSGAGLGWKTWNAAVVLVEFFGLHLSETIANRRVLELGCGTGLSGIFCAKFGAESVLMTDFNETVLQTVAQNADRNALPNVTIKRLDWLDLLKEKDDTDRDESIERDFSEHSFETIIGSDIVYDPDHADIVPKVVDRLLALNEHARAYICVGPRPEASKFMENMEFRYGFEAETHQETFFIDSKGDSFHHDLLVYKRHQLRNQ